MPKFAKSWFRPSRDAWYVTVAGKQHCLSPCSEEEAWDRANELKRQLERDPHAGSCTVTHNSLAAVIDAFLDWGKPRRAPDTFEWHRYRRCVGQRDASFSHATLN